MRINHESFVVVADVDVPGGMSYSPTTATPKERVYQRAKTIETTREYAEEYEISAIEQIYKIPIVIYDNDGNLRRCMAADDFAARGWSAPSEFWFIVYSGNNHYDVLELVAILPAL